MCRFFLAGNCTFGDRCRNAHTVDNPQEPGSSSLEPPWPAPPPEQAFPALGEQAFPALAARRPAAPTARSEQKPCGDAECGICFENVRARGERFGLLENCDHAFCLGCIRGWRKQREQDRKNLRMCPVCRNESGFVIPSDTLIPDPDEKSAVIETYKNEMERIPCKLFNYGKGKCPFGTSCFYAHLNPDGTRYVPPPLRWMAGADGSEVRGQVKLSDFLDRWQGGA